MNTSSPLAFIPQGERIACSAFSPVFKALAVLLVALALGWGWHLWASGALAWSIQSGGWFIAALAMMVYTAWHILTGKTVLDRTALQQSWVWNKRVELSHLAYAKLFRVHRLEWLIAPRLYVRTFSGKLATFYATDSHMLDEFKRLEEELASLRQQR